MTRAARILFVANDGFSAGHVARALAIAGAVGDVAATRGIEARVLLATTSEADALLASDPRIAVVRLPAPERARRAGFGDVERRRVVGAVLRGAVDGLAPDAIVVDTFANGPHDELAGIEGVPRVVVRRAVADPRAPVMTRGLEACALAIVADDPTPQPIDLPIACRRVPPIVLGGARAPRDAARRELRLPPDGRAILVAAGGGGDADSVAAADGLVARIARLAPDAIVVRAAGPLERAPRALRIAPLAPWLAAFDAAVAPAGYNTAHELAAAGVPAVLFARPRPFDDQAARAARFAAAGFAHALADTESDAAVAEALAWCTPRTPLIADGAARAAALVLDVATGAFA